MDVLRGGHPDEHAAARFRPSREEHAGRKKTLDDARAHWSMMVPEP